MIKICKTCVTPNTRPRVVFNEEGICNACLNSLNKKKIDWEDRKKEFNKIINKIKNFSKKNNNEYDCIVPWSGGKDSTSIALKLKEEFGLNPLLVTFSPLILNKIGQFNREILINRGFDSLMFRPNQNVSKKLAKRFFEERGNPKVAWDAGVNVIPLKVAINYKIPFLFYAEHGESEYGGLTLHKNSNKIRDYEEVVEHQIGDYSENWVNDDISLNDLYPYVLPKQSEIKSANITSYYFSYFFKWSMADNYDYVKNKLSDFKVNESGRTCGTFTNFDSLDDKIDDLYYYMQFIKFGFGRSVRDVSRFVQNDRLTREKGIDYVKKYDGEFPSQNISEVISYLGLTEKKFREIIDKHRNNEIWKKNSNNDWFKSWDLKFKIF